MPSKSRGLRTSTGCFTCRKRRVKCDEARPLCNNCNRVNRECFYADQHTSPRLPRQLSARKGSRSSTLTDQSSSNCRPNVGISLPDIGLDPAPVQPTQSWLPFSVEQPQDLSNLVPDDGLILDDSPFTLGNNLAPDFGPLEWYDLLAEDAINSMQGQSHSHRWDFDISSLSRRQTPRQSVGPEVADRLFEGGQEQVAKELTFTIPPWNTHSRIELTQEDLVFFGHYVDVVAPILDLFDASRHFASVVPHLAFRNVGLLKSLLAVGACHKVLYQHHDHGNGTVPQPPPDSPVSTSSTLSTPNRVAEQYYYETLQYMSQNLMYEGYTASHEILATAIMIGTYEMFLVGVRGNSDQGNWDRHLRGAFWIQRNSGVSGESSDSLSRAIWWAWLRQDVWAAFSTGRPALTIHQPKIAMSELSADGLATRIIYITAKCVQFAATPKEGDLCGYIEAGDRLLRMLETWKRMLPPSFEPIPVAASAPLPASPPDTTQITPIWIHPPACAAAMQMYHFARIIMVLHQPSSGGLSIYQTRFRLLHESTSTICGIAVAQQSRNLPSAFVSSQALYAAALCAETPDRQRKILDILDQVLGIARFPPRSVLDGLVGVWGGLSPS